MKLIRGKLSSLSSLNINSLIFSPSSVIEYHQLASQKTQSRIEARPCPESDWLTLLRKLFSDGAFLYNMFSLCPNFTPRSCQAHEQPNLNQFYNGESSQRALFVVATESHASFSPAFNCLLGNGGRQLKGGYLLRYKKQILWTNSWSEEWVVLYEDSTMAWFAVSFIAF